MTEDMEATVKMDTPGGKKVIINIFFKKKINIKLINLAYRLAGRKGYKEKDFSGLTDEDKKSIFLGLANAAVKAIENNPNIVTADEFAINLAIAPLKNLATALYDERVSSPVCAFVYVDSNYAINCCEASKKFANGDEEKIRESLSLYFRPTLAHEFRHHEELGAIMFEKEGFVNLKNNRKLCSYGFGIIFMVKIALYTRLEAVTTLESAFSVQQYQTIPMKKILSMQSMFLRPFDEKEQEKFIEFNSTNIKYYFGMLMALTIALNYRIEQSRGYANPDEIKSLKTLFSRDMENENMDIIPYLRFIYANQKEMKEIITDMSKMNKEDFMRTYEYACKKLKIPDRNVLLTWSKYKKGMRNSYDEYVEQLENRGFFSDIVRRLVYQFFKSLGLMEQ